MKSPGGDILLAREGDECARYATHTPESNLRGNIRSWVTQHDKLFHFKSYFVHLFYFLRKKDILYQCIYSAYIGYICLSLSVCLLSLYQSTSVCHWLEVEFVFSMPVRLWLTSVSLQCTALIKPPSHSSRFLTSYHAYIQKHASLTFSLCLLASLTHTSCHPGSTLTIYLPWDFLFVCN